MYDCVQLKRWCPLCTSILQRGGVVMGVCVHRLDVGMSGGEGIYFSVFGLGGIRLLWEVLFPIPQLFYLPFIYHLQDNTTTILLSGLSAAGSSYNNCSP